MMNYIRSQRPAVDVGGMLNVHTLSKACSARGWNDEFTYTLKGLQGTWLEY